MPSTPLEITYIGGPTALLNYGGIRLLTDPTFDPAPSSYQSGASILRKTAGPAIAAEDLDPIDSVLLSHDHHADNLDNSGREFLSQVTRVITTVAGAERLGAPAVGFDPWETIEIQAPDNRLLQVTSTPARHGPAHMDRGPVTGFVLAFQDAPEDGIYISGDTVWYEGVEEVAKRFPIRTAILFVGAARVAAVGPWDLTMTAADAVAAANAFAKARIVPLHYEGWAHLSQGRADVEAAFRAAGLEKRLRWLPAAKPVVMD